MAKQQKGAWSRPNPRNYGVEDFVDEELPAPELGEEHSQSVEKIGSAFDYLESLKRRK